MSRTMDSNAFLLAVRNVIKGLNPKARMVVEDIPGVGIRPVFEGGTFARDNLAGFVEASVDGDLMADILTTGLEIPNVTPENALATWRNTSPEGFIFRRKTGSGASYFVLSALEVENRASDSVSNLFTAPTPVASASRKAKK